MNPMMLLLASFLLPACSSVGPASILVAPDDARLGDDGADGPSGAAVVELAVQDGLSEAFAADVVYPADAAGDPLSGPHPTWVLVQGANVDPARYRWLAGHVATRGFAVVMPRHPGDLALYRPDRARVALDAAAAALPEVVDTTGPAVVGGHSLGGVVSAIEWARDARFDGLILLASYPAGGTDVAARAGTPVLSVSGDGDGRSAVEDVAEGWRRFEEPRHLAVVAGMNHYAWTDDVEPAEASSEPAATRPDAETRRDAQRVLDAWLDGVLQGDTDAWARLGTPLSEGITWY